MIIFVCKQVRAKIENYLPKQYIAEPTHKSDCHMVVKVAKWRYGQGSNPGTLQINAGNAAQATVGVAAGVVGGAAVATAAYAASWLPPKLW
jgi:hypothetical protein